MISSGVWTNLAIGIVGMLFLRFITSSKRKQKYLPGPRRLPILGNLLQMPEADGWETYLEWKKTYGDAIYLEVLGSPIVILNSYQACVDLLEKRSELYSDRPKNILNGMMGWDKAITLSHYGDRWRRYRRISAQFLRKEGVSQFHPIQEKEVGNFLATLLEKPESYMESFRFAAARSLLMAMYGIDVKGERDPIIITAEQAMEAALTAAQPGNFMVEFIPALKYVPEWFPGTGWKQWARHARELTDDMVDIPFKKTVEAMKTGDYEPSFTSLNLEKNEDEDIIKWSAGTMLTAGTDTSVASMHNFIYAMVTHPEIQKRAQREIDMVVGTDRLPSMSDASELHFLNAVMREMMRWAPVSPIALPHCLTRDDIYNGRFIPAGTVVIGNTWAIVRDPTIYEEPEKFNPDRFLPLFDKSVPQGPKDLPLDPLSYTFGYGRRICSGKHYAESMVFVSMARLLAAFDLGMAQDAQGKNIVPEEKFKSSLVREIVPFTCKITPRSEAARALVAAHS